MYRFLTYAVALTEQTSAPEVPTSQISLPLAVGVIGAGAVLLVLLVLIPAIRKSKKP